MQTVQKGSRNENFGPYSRKWEFWSQMSIGNRVNQVAKLEIYIVPISGPPQTVSPVSSLGVLHGDVVYHEGDICGSGDTHQSALHTETEFTRSKRSSHSTAILASHSLFHQGLLLVFSAFPPILLFNSYVTSVFPRPSPFLLCILLSLYSRILRCPRSSGFSPPLLQSNLS
jgi:hypothetical protein